MRDERRFGEAHNRAQWLADFHDADFAVFVSCRDPEEYSVTRLEWMDENELMDGTSFYQVRPSKAPTKDKAE